jgi:Tfp pilus assembly protein PilV
VLLPVICIYSRRRTIGRNGNRHGVKRADLKLGRRTDSGFTILEVALATFVLTLGIGSSLIGLQAGFKQIDLARGTTLASQIIQSEMERIRMLNWSAVSALPASETFDGGTNFTTSPDVVGKFTVTRTTAVDTTRPTEVMNINVSVNWKTYDGRSHRRTFSSIYSKNGLYDFFYTVAHQ